MGQNWNWLDLRKAAPVLKQLSNNFIIWYFECIDIQGDWCFTLSNFLINENLLQYFPQNLLLGLVIFEYILYLIYFLLLKTSFTLLRVSLLLSLLHGASVDIADDEGSF